MANYFETAAYKDWKAGQQVIAQGEREQLALELEQAEAALETARVALAEFDAEQEGK